MKRFNVRISRLKLLLLVIGLLISAEIYCRIKACLSTKDPYYLAIPFSSPKKQKATTSNIINFFQYTKNWYYKLKPGSYSAPAGYGYDSYKINSLGFRGKEFNPLDKKGKIRIFCVGESTTFGIESSEERTWPFLLEYYLKQNNKEKFEVINSGFGGADSLNSLNIIQHELLNYKPDMLIIMSGINDIQYEAKETSRIAQKLNSLLYYKSMLYTLLIEKISVLLHKSPIPANQFELKINKEYNNNMAKIIKICKDNNIALIFLRQMLNVDSKIFKNDYISIEEMKKTEKENQKNDVYKKLILHNECMRQIKELCDKKSLKFIDLREKFYNALINNERIFADYVHLLPRANEIIAESVSEQILSSY